MENPISSQSRLLVLAPSRRAVSETFIRANLNGLSLDLTAYFGDDFPLYAPWRLAYGSAILLSKLLTRLHWLRLAGFPAACVAFALIRRHQPEVVMVEFGCWRPLRLCIIGCAKYFGRECGREERARGVPVWWSS